MKSLAMMLTIAAVGWMAACQNTGTNAINSAQRAGTALNHAGVQVSGWAQTGGTVIGR